MMLVGITGHSGAKKSKIAKRLRKAHGFSYFHAGDPVKDAVRVAFKGLTEAAVDGKRKDSPSHLLGGAVPRDLMEAAADRWSEVAPHAIPSTIRRRATKRMSKGRDVVVDGIRTPEQGAVIKRMGGFIIRANNGKTLDPEKPMDRRQALVNHDIEVDTSGKKADIKAHTDQALDRLVARCDM